MPTPTKVLLTFILLCFLGTTFASDKKVKFGKINISHLEKTSCPIDSNAHAYYIFDKGNTEFYYSEGFKLKYNRHFRIKILDVTALDEATFEIPLYVGNDGREEMITGIKAITHNLDEGNIIPSKLNKKDIIYEKKTKNRTIAKFSLPNVKAGSVIEVSYKILSDFIFNLNDWYFQYKIPVLHSEYYVNIPEYYKYKQFPFGYETYETKKTSSLGTLPIGTPPLQYRSDVYTYTANNIPAFPEGEHLTSINNYITHIEFELEGVQWPYEPYKSYFSTWTQIGKEMMESSSIGDRLKETRCFNDITPILMQNTPNAIAKMQAAFDYIKSNTKWNMYSSRYTSQSFRKTLDEGVGNCADINLALVTLLREMGLTAYPVALSTRSHGFLKNYFPSISQLNYMIASCNIDGKTYLLDATNDYTSVNLLPTRCLNGQGLVIMDKTITWVPLSNNFIFKEKNTYALKLSNDGVITGQKKDSYVDYGAYIFRNRFSDHESKEKFIEEFENENEGLSVVNYSFENIDSSNNTVNCEYEIKMEDQVGIMGDLMVFSPMFYDGIYSNPLKLEKREYPVEYTYPYNYSTSVMINIPDGYVIESLPQSVHYKSEDINCTYKYIIQAQQNTLLIRTSFIRNQTIFPFDQYDELKHFYESISKKHNEKIVLKKEVVQALK